MSKIRNVSGDARVVPGLGGRFVDVGQVVDVDDELVASYTGQAGIWEPADHAAQLAHDAAYAEPAATEAEPVAETEAEPVAETEAEPVAETEAEPARRARTSREG
ncbi:MAG: hypothetical protein KBF43_09005 [Dermatophilaceae bacterium]|nr:hypothetical protein [Dermatophilaceae bacterium]